MGRRRDEWGKESLRTTAWLPGPTGEQVKQAGNGIVVAVEEEEEESHVLDHAWDWAPIRD